MKISPMDFIITHKCSRFLLSFMFTSASIYSLYGQISIENDFKKELWKTIKPTNLSPQTNYPTTIKANENSVLNNKYMKAYEDYKYKSTNLLELFKDKYQISPNLTTYKGNVPLNRLPNGATQVVYMGGHFMLIPVGGTSITPSGISLSGGGRKKLSQKSKSILQNVFGMEIEE